MNIALIGLGMVAQTHVDAIRDAGFQIASVMGRDLVRTQTFAKDVGARACADVQDIADDPDIDFVILATPPNARCNLVKVLARAGKPILMEKPVERNLEAATEIVEICEARNVPLGVVFQHRMRAASLALKDAMTADELGEICTVDLRVPWWRDQSYYDAPGRGSYARDGGGAMISQAIHTLDLALWLLGPVQSVQSLMRTTRLHKLEAEDWAGALLEFEGGAVGSLMATTAAFPGRAESITIQGSKAAAHLEAGVLRLEYLDGRVETVGAAASTGGGADPMAFTHAWHQSVIEDFAQVIRTGRSPLAAGRAALGTHAVIDAMERANETGQRTTVRLT